MDLQVWMIVSTDAMAQVANLMDEKQDAAHFEQLRQNFTDVLDTEFWDEERQIYDEFYYNS